MQYRHRLHFAKAESNNIFQKEDKVNLFAFELSFRREVFAGLSSDQVKINFGIKGALMNSSFC